MDGVWGTDGRRMFGFERLSSSVWSGMLFLEPKKFLILELEFQRGCAERPLRIRLVEGLGLSWFLGFWDLRWSGFSAALEIFIKSSEKFRVRRWSISFRKSVSLCRILSARIKRFFLRIAISSSCLVRPENWARIFWASATFFGNRESFSMTNKEFSFSMK